MEKIEPIKILLNSTLNIEFVYVILEGIVKFSKMNFSTKENQHQSEENEALTATRKVNGDVTLEIRQIKIQDFD